MAKISFKVVVKRVFLVLFLALLVIQFIHPARNANATVTALDLNAMYPIPDSVNEVLKKACNDCHTNNTRYPWYSNIQPVDWWLNDHITEGKKELNFSEYGKRTLPKQAKKLRKIAKEVKEGGMPLDSYTWIHNDAVLTDHEKQMIIDWATNLSQQITARYVADSIAHAQGAK